MVSRGTSLPLEDMTVLVREVSWVITRRDVDWRDKSRPKDNKMFSGGWVPSEHCLYSIDGLLYLTHLHHMRSHAA